MQYTIPVTENKSNIQEDGPPSFPPMPGIWVFLGQVSGFSGLRELLTRSSDMGFPFIKGLCLGFGLGVQDEGRGS